MWKNFSQIPAKTHSNNGYTLPEVMAAVVIIGVLAVIAGPVKSWFENPLADATNQTVGILNIIRMRAISTTSAYRIQPDPLDPTTKFRVEIAQTRGCESSTQLTSDEAATETQLEVASTNGLVIGDSVEIGSDSEDNEIIATDASSITLGQPLGTTQPANATVELINNWFNDPNLTEEDLTLPKDIEVTGTPENWSLCFDSRGIANLYDASGTIVNNTLTLTLTNTFRGEDSQVQVLQGGSVTVTN
ncbi:MAG: prepilin-type N-terminal cleavage/methylation domain-containing protein [Cyanobacteria bacterium P01_G01_bin.49]